MAALSIVSGFGEFGCMIMLGRVARKSLDNADNANGATIMGVQARNLDAWGVLIDAGADDTGIVACDLRGNTSGAISNGGTNTNAKGNLGASDI